MDHGIDDGRDLEGAPPFGVPTGESGAGQAHWRPFRCVRPQSPRRTRLYTSDRPRRRDRSDGKDRSWPSHTTPALIGAASRSPSRERAWIAWFGIVLALGCCQVSTGSSASARVGGFLIAVSGDSS